MLSVWGCYLTFVVVVFFATILIVVIFIYIKVKYSLCFVCFVTSLSLFRLVYVLFLVYHIQKDKEKGLVVIAIAVNVVNALTIDLFTAMDKFSERIQHCKCVYIYAIWEIGYDVRWLA